MYAERKDEVSPVMYCKWILRQKNPAARRDVQYLFNLCNNKDLKSVDSGIYASLRTSRIPNLNKKLLLDKIKNKDQELEANLSTVLASVRGSNEYWSRICGDLKLMDETYGSATFFLSLSCAEYSWVDCINFVRFMNQDLCNVKNCDIRSLISNDPMSTSVFFHHKFVTFFTKLF